MPYKGRGRRKPGSVFGVGLTGLAALVDDLGLCAFEIDAEGIAVPIPKILYARQSHRFCFQITDSITVTPRKPLLFVHRAI